MADTVLPADQSVYRTHPPPSLDRSRWFVGIRVLSCSLLLLWLRRLVLYRLIEVEWRWRRWSVPSTIGLKLKMRNEFKTCFVETGIRYWIGFLWGHWWKNQITHLFYLAFKYVSTWSPNDVCTLELLHFSIRSHQLSSVNCRWRSYGAWLEWHHCCQVW